jgi:hypothetical protein
MPPRPAPPRPALSPPVDCWTSSDHRRSVVCRTPLAGVGRQNYPESQRRICPHGHTTNARGAFESRGAFVVPPSTTGQAGGMFLGNGRGCLRQPSRFPKRFPRDSAIMRLDAGPPWYNAVCNG